MAGQLLPPVIQQVAATLSALEKILAEEVPDTMVAVTWARCPNYPTNRDPFKDAEQISHVAIDGKIHVPTEARAVLEARFYPGRRSQAETLPRQPNDLRGQMDIGTYWSRFYLGKPEPENNEPEPGNNGERKCICAECVREREGDPIKFTSVISEADAPASRRLFQQLLGEMQHYYDRDPHKAGFSISVIPTNDRPNLFAVHGIWCEMAPAIRSDGKMPDYGEFRLYKPPSR